MMVAVLIGELDQRVGRTVVPPDALAVRHRGDVYVRTTETIRLTKTGTGMGKVFRLAEVYERPRLEML